MYVGHSPFEDFRGATGPTPAPARLAASLLHRSCSSGMPGENWECDECHCAHAWGGRFLGRIRRGKRSLLFRFWNKKAASRVYEKRSTDQICAQLSSLEPILFLHMQDPFLKRSLAPPRIHSAHPVHGLHGPSRARQRPDTCRRVSDVEASSTPRKSAFQHIFRPHEMRPARLLGQVRAAVFASSTDCRPASTMWKPPGATPRTDSVSHTFACGQQGEVHQRYHNLGSTKAPSLLSSSSKVRGHFRWWSFLRHSGLVPIQSKEFSVFLTSFSPTLREGCTPLSSPVSHTTATLPPPFPLRKQHAPTTIGR